MKRKLRATRWKPLEILYIEMVAKKHGMKTDHIIRAGAKAEADRIMREVPLNGERIRYSVGGDFSDLPEYEGRYRTQHDAY